MKTEDIPLEKITIPNERVRATFTPEQEEELKASIEKHGFYIPIMVQPLEDGQYELIDGEHRVNIVSEMGWETIPAVITEQDSQKASMLNILANTARGDQNPMDVAEALKRAYDQGAEIEELASATGHQSSWVKLYLTFTELPQTYQDALRKGELKVGHLQEALKLQDPTEIDAALNTAWALKWKVSEMAAYVKTRTEEMKEAEAKGDRETLEEPPSFEEAAAMVEYRTCQACQGKVKREEVRMPSICEHCRTLLMYITDQIGTGEEAMEEIANAVNFYRTYRRAESWEKPVHQQGGYEEPKTTTVNPSEAQSSQNQPVSPSPSPEQQQQGKSLDEVMEKYGLRWDDPQIAQKLKTLKEIGEL